MNSHLVCFVIGFLIDKISIFPFVLGCGTGIFLVNNDMYKSLKGPVKKGIDYISKNVKK